MNNSELNFIFNRRSIRKFTSQPIPQDVITELMRAVISAPSAGNLQNYSVILITSPDKKSSLYELCGKQQWILEASLLLLFCVDTNRLFRWVEVMGGSFHFNGASVFLTAFADTVIAAHTAVLAGELLGLGSVYIGRILNEPVSIVKLFKLPKFVFPAVLLCMGYPAEIPYKTSRLPMGSIIHEEEYKDYTVQEVKNIFRDKEEGFLNWCKNDPVFCEKLSKMGITTSSRFTTLYHYPKDFIQRVDKNVKEALMYQGFLRNSD